MNIQMINDTLIIENINLANNGISGRRNHYRYFFGFKSVMLEAVRSMI